MKPLLCLVVIVATYSFSYSQRGGAQSAPAIQKAELLTRVVNFSPTDSNQTISGQSNYLLKVYLPDTSQVHTLRVNGQSAQGLSTISNSNHPLKNQVIYRNPKSRDYVVYIDLGNRPTGSVKNGNVMLVGKNGNPLPGQASSRAFTSP